MTVKRIQARKRKRVAGARPEPAPAGRRTDISTAVAAELPGGLDLTLDRIDRLLGRPHLQVGVTRA